MFAHGNPHSPGQKHFVVYSNLPWFADDPLRKSSTGHVVNTSASELSESNSSASFINILSVSFESKQKLWRTTLGRGDAIDSRSDISANDSSNAGKDGTLETGKSDASPM